MAKIRYLQRTHDSRPGDEKTVDDACARVLVLLGMAEYSGTRRAGTPGVKFLMSLALRMGRTLSELRQSMTASEMLMWIEYDRISPVGDIRGDIQAAQIVSAVYGSQGAKVPLSDAILQWGERSNKQTRIRLPGLRMHLPRLRSNFFNIKSDEEYLKRPCEMLVQKNSEPLRRFFFVRRMVMATLRELIIKISADSSSFQSEITRASRMGSDYYRTMQAGGRQAAVAAKESERALSDLTNSFASAGKAAAAATVAFATGKLVQIADEWNSVNARLQQASASADDFATSQRQLMDISQRTGTAFSDNANLFARAAASMREYGYSSEEVLKITEAVSTGFKLSGASTQESSSVITQFSQALAQGVLRGEEFNAVNESGDRVIRALATGMGVARKDLKSMADQGKLTIDKVVPALMSQLGVLQGEFATMPQTVSGSLQKVTNSFMGWVGGVNAATGATDALSGGLDGVAQTLDSFTSSAVSGALSDVADNMSVITTVAGALVGIGLAKYLSGIVTSATSATGALISAAKSEVALAVAQDRADD